MRLAVAALLLALCVPQRHVLALVVDTRYGQLRGFIHPSSAVRIFKGIPFAAVPTGGRRFAPPAAPQPWTGLLDATRYRAGCMSKTLFTQSPQKNVSEDCLYLNIFADSRCNQAEKCAVIAYIHGGSFYYDSAVMFDDEAIVEKYASHGIVFVVAAYRLGIFGFASLRGVDANVKNIGIRDMIASLEWIHSEIHHFGGDPRRLTIVGNSAGATAVQLLALSPRVPEHLFSQGIAMSCTDLFRKDLSSDITASIVHELHCDETADVRTKRNTTPLECLRSKSAWELVDAQQVLTDFGNFDLIFGPEPETEFFPALVPAYFPTLNKRNFMLGLTKNEFAFMLGHTPAEQCVTSTSVFGYHTQAAVDKCIEHYDSNEKKRLVMLGEQRASTRRIADKLSSGGAHVFVYSFELPARDFHASDLPFLIGLHPIPQMTDAERAIDQLYPALVRNFAITGDPGQGWKEYTTARREYFVITRQTLSNGATVDSTMKDDFFPEESEFWLRSLAAAEASSLYDNAHTIAPTSAIPSDSNSSISTVFVVGVLTIICLAIAAFIIVHNSIVRKSKVHHQQSLPDERTRMLTTQCGKLYLSNDVNRASSTIFDPL